MDKIEKNNLINSLNIEFINAKTVVVAHYAGLTVLEASALRNKMREAGGVIKVVKNRLAKIACSKTDKECLSELLVGPTLIAFSKDPIASARVIYDFSKKNNKLIIVGGVFDDQLLDVNDIKNLATLPSLDELRGKIIGVLQAPATKVVGVISAPVRQVASVIQAYADKAA